MFETGGGDKGQREGDNDISCDRLHRCYGAAHILIVSLSSDLWTLVTQLGDHGRGGGR